MSLHQNAGQIHNTRITNRCFENMTKLKYLGTTVTKSKLYHKEIRNRLNLGNASYHSVQKFCLLVCCKNYNFSVVLYGCETWPLTLREYKMRVLEYRVLKRIVNRKGIKYTRMEKTA
jgi:hypothetical protein